MKLWLISLPDDITVDYDQYDSAVVAAASESRARQMHPNGNQDNCRNSTWPISPERVVVKLIGTATPGTKESVICSSFNAG